MSTKQLSQKDFEIIYKGELKRIGKKHFDERKREEQLNNKKSNTRSIFLCHCSSDKTIVNKAFALFKSLNVDLYIDWLDDNLPKLTDKNTASSIKAKIDDSQKFIFLATYNALRSRWCNWELGLAYSSKGEKNIAILPIESRNGNWPGNEYLQLYPEMQIDSLDLNGKLISENDIKISFYDQDKISFGDWLGLSK